MSFAHKFLRAALVTTTLSTVCVVGASAASIGVGSLNQDAVRIRESASIDSPVLATVFKGEYVVIQEKVDEEWYKVEYQSQEGYMASDYVDLIERITAPSIAYGQVQAPTGLNIRSEASIESERLGALDDEEIVSIVGFDTGWFKIKFGEDDKIGYVLSDYMFVTKEAPPEPEPEPTPTPTVTSSSSKSSSNKSSSNKTSSSSSNKTSNSSSSKTSSTSKKSSSSNNNKKTTTKTSSSSSSTDKKASSASSSSASSVGQQIASYAQNFLGCRYVYGASGPNSFDCSGFTKYVYQHFGYSLPHGATSAMKYGSKVSRGEWKPGDLIFFSHSKSGRADHIGIYIGGGKVIHASTNGNKVRVDTLLSGYYSNFYYTARRLV